MRVEGNYYTSELSVRTNTGMNGRTVHCVSNSNSGILTVGDTFILSKFLDAHACTCVCIYVYAHVVVQVYVGVTMYYGSMGNEG